MRETEATERTEQIHRHEGDQETHEKAKSQFLTGTSSDAPRTQQY